MTNLQMHLTKILKNEQAKSLFLKVAQGAIFMEHNMSFRLFFGQLAILKKKIGADYEHFFSTFFSCFYGQKKRKIN